MEKQITKHWILEGLIVAATPIAVYLLAFAYEAGFARTFEIPIQFITINLVSAFIAANALLIVVILLFWLTNLIFMVLPRKNEIIYRKLLRSFPFLLIFLSQFIIYGLRWKEWIFFMILLIIIVLSEFGFPIISQWNKGSFRKILEIQEKLDKQQITLVDKVRQYFGAKGVLIICFVVFCVLISYDLGRSNALKAEKFLVIDRSPQMVVLRIYGDKMICSPFIRETKKTQKKFLILKMGEDSELILNLEKVGPLQVMNEVTH